MFLVLYNSPKQLHSKPVYPVQYMVYIALTQGYEFYDL